MKKSRLLLSAVACLTLTGCSINDLMFWKQNKEEEKQQEQQQGEKNWELNPTIEGGTEEQKLAILDTLNNKPICNQNGKKSSEIFYDVQPTLNEDDGDGIKLTKKQIQSAGDVVLTWSIDQTQTYFGGILQSDEAHDIVEIKYQGYGVPDGEFKWSLTSLVCGEAHTVDFKLDYSAKTRNEVYKHDDIKIKDIYKITKERKVVKDASNKVVNMWESTFDMIDYEFDPSESTYSPYFESNNPGTEKAYLYYNVPGKVIYLAPDGNWGLLADGKDVLEFYAGSGTALTEKNWPNLAGKYVKISGNMGQYCGNVQLGFVTKIAALTDAEKAEITEPEPVVYTQITEAVLSNLHPQLTAAELTALGLDPTKDNYACDQQAVELADGTCLSNTTAQVTGTLVADSLKDKDGNAVAVNALSSGSRYTFQLQVGAEKMTVAYDYHTDKTGKNGLFNAMKAALNAGGEMTIKGTMRYSGNNSGPFISVGNAGVWNIVPFLTEHFA